MEQLEKKYLMTYLEKLKGQNEEGPAELTYAELRRQVDDRLASYYAQKVVRSLNADNHVMQFLDNEIYKKLGRYLHFLADCRDGRLKLQKWIPEFLDEEIESLNELMIELENRKYV